MGTTPITTKVTRQNAVFVESVPSGLDELQENLLAKYGGQYTGIEDLPLEIQRHLLLQLDFRELKALVRASAVYHRQYAANRRFILVRLLDSIMGSALVDACAVHRASALGFSLRRTDKTVSEFLTGYRGQLQQKNNFRIITQHLTETNAAIILSFYNAVVKDLIRQCAWTSIMALTKAREIDADSINSESASVELTDSESLRFMRGFYRYELACLLYGPGPYLNRRPTALVIVNYEILGDFLGLYPPWEIEEIGCAYSFVNEIFCDEYWMYMNEHLEIMDMSDDLDESMVMAMAEDWFCNAIKGQMMRGLRTVSEVLYEFDDCTEEESTYAMLETYSDDADFLADAWSARAQIERRRYRHSPTDGDLKEERRDSLIFHNDRIPEKEGENASWAWHLIWDHTYSNCFGGFICSKLRNWSYVMWDAKRIDQLGAQNRLRDHLLKHYDGQHEHSDPRDFLRSLFEH